MKHKLYVSLVEMPSKIEAVPYLLQERNSEVAVEFDADSPVFWLPPHGIAAVEIGGRSYTSHFLLHAFQQGHIPCRIVNADVAARIGIVERESEDA